MNAMFRSAVRSVLFVVFSLGIVSVASAQSESGKAIIILDASGSMWGQIDGKPKIEIARDVIADLLQSLDPELEIGLMAYGHREKGNCDDIELLVPPEKGNRQVFLDKVMSIIPKGKTPLTDAVEQAANFLKYQEDAANVILVSDGLETCDRDPCILSKQLAANGISFRTHIVAFDLTAEESASIRCLADDTGGAFLQAQDAVTLKDAMEIAVEAASVVKVETMPEPEPVAPATLQSLGQVPAGSGFTVEWEGPDNQGDYVTIVAKDQDDHIYGNYAYTRSGNPSKLTAPVQLGAHEVRYLSGGKVIGRADIEVIEPLATLEHPAEVIAGTTFSVTWKGPDNKGDYVTIVPKGADDGAYRSYAYTGNGNPLELRAINEVGEAEVRYLVGNKSLVSSPITIVEADVLVSGPEAIEAGSQVTVEWKGPNGPGDFITIVKKDAAKGKYNGYAYTKNSKDGTLTFKAPEEAGDDYEIRYVESQQSNTIATAPIILRPVTATVNGPASAVAGSEIEITWTGPDFAGYFITVVDKATDIGRYGNYFYTKNAESPTKLVVPEVPGEAEIRFMTQGSKMLTSAPITITAATATFSDVPEKVAAGGKFRVAWEGPDNRGDYVTIVKAGADEGTYTSYIYVQNGQDQDLTAPAEAGEYEIRYVTNKLGKTLGSAKVTVVAE